MTFPEKKSVPFQLSTLFGDVVIPKQRKAKPKTPPPFSLRLTAEERSRLDQDAGSVPLGAYIRSRLFDGSAPPRSPAKRPLKDQQALARVLAELGQSRIANNLNQLARGMNTDTLDITPETLALLNEACEAVKAMRHDLMTGLGLNSGERP